jgi:hypothetical protein
MNDEHRRKIKVIERVLKNDRLKNSADWGRLGEKFTNVKEQKYKIPSLTETAKYRVPDILLDSELIEIKNVKRLRMTNQLKDFRLFCKQTNRKFVIYVRTDTSLTSEVSTLASSSEIKIRYLSKIFSEDGKIVSEAIAKALEIDDLRAYIRKKLVGKDD